MIKGLIFDMDGTIFDTERLYYKGWKNVARDNGYELPDELLDTMRGGALDVCERIFNSYFKGARDFLTDREQRQKYIFKEVAEKGIPYKPGLKELFSFLKENGYKKALATSTHRKVVDFYLSNCDMSEDDFDFIMTGDMVKNGKPAPDIFIMAAKGLGLDPSECAVVEDSKNGIRAGYDSGARVIHIPDLEKITDKEEAMLSAKLGTLTDIRDWLLKVNGESEIK